MLSRVVLVASLLLSMSGDAWGDAAAAESRFLRGKQLMSAGLYKEACAEFEASQELDSSAGTLLNLGECYVKLGKTASAWSSFKMAAVRANTDNEPRRSEFALERAGDLEAKLTRVHVRGPAEAIPGLQVFRNGNDLTSALGIAVPIDPGSYEFVVTAPGRVEWKKSVTIAGEAKTVTLDIPTLELEANGPVALTGPERLPPNASLEAEQPPADSQRGRRLLTFGIAGGGLAVAATGLVFGGLARSDHNASKEYCSSLGCTSKGAMLVDEAKTKATVSTVLVGIGGVALVGSAILWLTAPSGGTRDDTSTTQLLPILDQEITGLAITGDFN